MATNTSDILPVIDFLSEEFDSYEMSASQQARYDKRLQDEKNLIQSAIEDAFVVCHREVNFCLNNEIVSRNTLANELLFACGNWASTYASDGEELFGVPMAEVTELEAMGEFLSVFAPAYLRSLIATLFDAPTGVAMHILPADADEVSMLTDDQMGDMEELSYEYENFQNPICHYHVVFGRAVACNIASAILAAKDSDDAFLSNLVRLDSKGIPVCAIAGLAAIQASSNTYVAIEEPSAPYGFDLIEAPIVPSGITPSVTASFYDMADGRSERDTSSPSLTTPAGIVDALRRDMTEEGIRYFASLPFRRGYEWIDRKNKIFVPNKSDEYLLDHLLREGILMPFVERAFWACARKDSHETYEMARKKADEYERRDGQKKTVYQCPFCGKFHVTKNLHFDDSGNASEQERLLWALSWHGVNSKETLFAIGRDFLDKNGARIVRRVRERWERQYGSCGRRPYQTGRAA